MKNSFKLNVNKLKNLIFVYRPDVYAEKLALLKQLSKSEITEKELIDYHECLLFICAYPESKSILNIAKQELERIANILKQLPQKQLKQFNDSGLPYSSMITRFSCDILFELLNQYKCNIQIDSFEEGGTALNTLLNLTLPSVLKQETTAGLDNIELLNLLGVQTKNRLIFLLNEFSKLENNPLLKDHLWESLKIYLNISAHSKLYSRSFNQLKINEVFFQTEILKKFDDAALLKAELPLAAKLNQNELVELAGIIRKSLLLTMRETDTSTYMDLKSLRLYHLERGVSIAIYGMNANRQLPYQSYIGYTAFKNGFPVAYGGSWIFGESAMFGLNMLETYRGGESGFIMCQLLRTYIQSFKLSYIEVENYQFGKDNPDGIKSGAFWFYYRYGFRPIDKKLNLLAAKEFEKINKDKNFRSSEKSLIALSESNIALNFKAKVPLKKEVIFNKVLSMIANEFEGDNLLAIKNANAAFYKKLGLKSSIVESEKQTFEEFALWAKALKVNDKLKLKLLHKMVSIKSIDAYQFNELIKEYSAINN